MKNKKLLEDEWYSLLVLSLVKEMNKVPKRLKIDVKFAIPNGP